MQPNQNGTFKTKDMEIIKASVEWAKAEVFSSTFFILFGVIFIVASAGFWQLGKTDLAKAFVMPALISGILLMVIGIGLVYSNNARIKNFPSSYESDSSAFVLTEKNRAAKTISEYKTIVFKIIPIIIILAALLIIFIESAQWRAIGITIIAMMIVILIIDSNAYSRIEAYSRQLELVE